MCVIIHQPKGEHIDKKTCQKLWAANSDGGGFAYITDARDIIVKKSMEFNKFWREFEQARSTNPNRDFLLHLRIATHGSVCLDNVHPFQVDENTIMAHNGIIHGVPDYKDDRTDTAVFIDEVLPELPPNWLDSSYLSSMVEEWIGWSRLMFMSTSSVLNYDTYRLGDWEEWKGLWLTNLAGLTEKIPKSNKNYQQPTGVYYFPQDDSAAWNAWEDTQNKVGSLSWEEDLTLKDNISDTRKGMQITHPILDELGVWSCYGCGKVIDLYTAECECWELICMKCWNFVARCALEGPCTASNQILYTSLEPKEVKNVKEAFEDRQKSNTSLVLVPTKGETNMMNPVGASGSSS